MSVEPEEYKPPRTKIEMDSLVMENFLDEKR
jgi:hypothetical protein